MTASLDAEAGRHLEGLRSALASAAFERTEYGKKYIVSATVMAFLTPLLQSLGKEVCLI